MTETAGFGLADLKAGYDGLVEAERLWHDARDKLADMLGAGSDGLSYETIGLLIVLARDARVIISSIEGHLAYLDGAWDEVSQLINSRSMNAAS